MSEFIDSEDIISFAGDGTILNNKLTNEELEIDMYCLIKTTAQYFHSHGLYINIFKTEYCIYILKQA